MYQPKPGDRILVCRTPGNHGPIGVMTGTVLDIVPIQGVPHLYFRCDQGGTVYLATNEEMAKYGRKQTIEPAP